MYFKFFKRQYRGKSFASFRRGGKRAVRYSSGGVYV